VCVQQWREADFDVILTRQQPTFWRVSTGRVDNPFLPAEPLPYYWSFFSFPALFAMVQPSLAVDRGILLTDLTAAEIDGLKARVASGSLHPKAAKVDLARRIVSEFHDAGAADLAAAEFERVHARGELPSDLKVVEVDFGGEPMRALSRFSDASNDPRALIRAVRLRSASADAR